jgi:MYXO-CTERM domain-containing protein
VERTLVAFTITLAATAPAHASHPPQTLQSQGSAGLGSFVGKSVSSPGALSGLVLARQVLPAPPPSPLSGGGAMSSLRIDPTDRASLRARSRTIFLNRDGAILRPGDNDARLSTSSIVKQPTRLTPWDIDDDTWDETVACVRELYARFDVTVTDDDPGDVPHIAAVFGGHPSDVGLPDNVAGVSPFTTDCGVIENSVVFTFTDVLPDDPRVMCEVMAQEIAHSFGADHELLAEDPMTYLDYAGERSFQDELASCGEDFPRPCGIDSYVCSKKQNSVQLLASRLGLRGTGAPGASETTAEPGVGSCQTSGSAGAPLALALAGLLLGRRRRPRPPASAAPSPASIGVTLSGPRARVAASPGTAGTPLAAPRAARSGRSRSARFFRCRSPFPIQS